VQVCGGRAHIRLSLLGVVLAALGDLHLELAMVQVL
jgi:hypothetical protein